MSFFLLNFAKINFNMATKKNSKNTKREPRKPNVPKAGVKHGTSYGCGGKLNK